MSLHIRIIIIFFFLTQWQLLHACPLCIGSLTKGNPHTSTTQICYQWERGISGCSGQDQVCVDLLFNELLARIDKEEEE